MDVARMHGCHVHQTEGSICVDARSKVSFQRWLLDWAIASWALRMSLLFGRCFAEVGWIFFFFASFDVGLFHFDPFAQHTPRKVTTRNILVTLSKWNLFFYWVFCPNANDLPSVRCSGNCSKQLKLASREWAFGLFIAVTVTHVITAVMCVWFRRVSCLQHCVQICWDKEDWVKLRSKVEPCLWLEIMKAKKSAIR